MIKSSQYRIDVALEYPYDTCDNHNFLQLILIEALHKIVKTESALRKEVAVECQLCNRLFQPDEEEEKWTNFDLAPDDSHCSRCASFINFMMKFKQVEKRSFLYEASNNSSLQGKSYDALYHSYAHYQLVRTKINYQIFSATKTPKALLSDYMVNIKSL